VTTDIISAIFMAQNASSGVRTRLIDTRHHYIRENAEDGIIKIEFVKSVEKSYQHFYKECWPGDLLET
jgi:hypothetical protein